MTTSNFGKGQRATSFLRLCLAIIVLLTMAVGGTALTPQPVQAITIAPLNFNLNVQECVSFTINPGFTTADPCCGGQPSNFIFFWKAGGPAWLNIDPVTGAFSGCPPQGSSIDPGNPWTITVGATCLWFGPVPPPCAGVTAPTATVILTVAPPPLTTPLTITPTWYPVAWENMLFSMTLAATGCSGTYNWTATGLPAGLSVTDATLGIISGTPAPGTCGIYNVTVTCTNTGMCPSAGCCPAVSAPFTLIVDCWANYLALIVIYPPTSCDFKVNIGPGLVNGQTNVVIDGKLEATLGGNQSAAFTSVPCQSHLVVVDQIIPGPDPKTRFVVKGSNQIMVSETNNIASFDYAQEVLIDTGSDPKGVSQPPGTGFYAMNSNFSTTTPSPIDTDNQKGIKYVFRAWSLPDGSTNPNRDLVFPVNKAGTAIAAYDTYYLFQVKSDYPSISERSWELKNSAAKWDVALQDVPTPNFLGLLGGVMRPKERTGTHLMTEPYTQIILWDYDYTIPIIIIAVVVLLIIGLVVFLILRRKRAGVTAVTAEAVAPVTQPPAVAPKAAKTTPAVAATVEQKALTEAESAEKPSFCPKCGSPVEKDAEFCKKCGKKLT